MNLASQKITINGGITSRTSADTVIEPITLNDHNHPLVFPLVDYYGNGVDPMVKVGDRVKAGALLASGILASRSGTIQHIKEHAFMHRSGQPALSVTLHPDTQQLKMQHPPLDPANVQSLAPYNILGLGGAKYPLLKKILNAKKSDIHTLLINAVECEPLVQCDNALIQWQATEVVQGIELLRQLCGIESATLAIKTTSEKAINNLENACRELDAKIDITMVEDKYPAGAERTLIRAITGTTTKSGLRPTDVGMLCTNVATAHALYRAQCGEALTGRIISVAKANSVIENVWAPFGTAVQDVLDAAGIHQHQGIVIAGGPISGFEIHNLTIPIDASTNSLIVEFDGNKTDPVPCIRCGDCAEVCPSNLLPQQLYWHSRSGNLMATEKFGLNECIECACCDLVCPSAIPLTQLFQNTKRELTDTAQESIRSNWAEQRHLSHQQRQSARKQHRKIKKDSTNPLDRLQQARRAKSKFSDGANDGMKDRSKEHEDSSKQPPNSHS